MDCGVATAQIKVIGVLAHDLCRIPTLNIYTPQLASLKDQSIPSPDSSVQLTMVQSKPWSLFGDWSTEDGKFVSNK